MESVMTESLPSDAGAAPATEATASTESKDVNQSAPEASAGGDSGAEAPKSVLDAVSAALKADKGAEGSPASQPDTNGEVKDSAEAEPLPDRPTPEELNSYHSRTRRRIKQLLDRGDKAETEIKTLQPLAEQARKINDFVDQSGLSWDEVNSGFNLMRLMKNDPFAAREALAPMMDALNKACGIELPPELKQKVDQGYVDEQTARDLAQAQQRARFATQANQQTVERIEQARAQEAHQRHVGSVTSAVAAFQDNWKKSDPDYATKSPLVMEKVELTLSRLARQGQTIVDPAQAVKIVEDAKKAVEATFKPFTSRNQPINPLPSGSVSATAGAKPRSMAEAVAQALKT
jgi:hypothetical protein